MNHFQFDGYRAYADLRHRYPEFLLDTVGVRGGALARLLTEFWTSEGSESSLFAPIVVQGAFPFSPGIPLAELASEKATADKPLHPKTVALLAKAGVNYPLFQHQVSAIRDARAGKSVVVSAGTGSGKTESFLFPIIDRLIRDHEEGRDDLSRPGVRALIVYPLNALVNSQVDRLLGLLGGQQQITFAYYTSRLKDTFTQAKNYLENHLGRPVPPACQIIDRKTLRGLGEEPGRPNGPPHILVTNFSMLEYMLIRPLDRTIFRQEHLFHDGKPRLKMVVLDEAHVYVGAQAAEMHMLLRRAADRFGTSLAQVQGFATSATLSAGAGMDPSASLREYACRMFAKPSTEVAVIEGQRSLPPTSLPRREDAPDLTPPDLVLEGELIPAQLRTIEFDSDGKAAGLVEDEAVAKAAADAAVQLGLARESDLSSIVDGVRKTPGLLLHQLISTHPRLVDLRAWLFDISKYPTLDEVAQHLYGSSGTVENRRRAAEAVLRLASLARVDPEKLPFIPVRMHAFVRAPLGVFVDPRPHTGSGVPEWAWGRLELFPATEGAECPRLPLLVCSNCGAPYLEGTLDGDGQPRASERAGTHVFFAASSASTKAPAIWGGQTVAVVEISSMDRHGNRVLPKCAKCGIEKPKLRTLRLSPRLALSAILDTVYPHLGEMPRPAGTKLPGDGRRLITFSDSRQEAARIASQVERSHDIGLNRALLWHRLNKEGSEPVRVNELVTGLADSPELAQRALAHELTDADAREDLAALSVYEEFGRPPAGRQNTLETMGLAEVVYPKIPARPSKVQSLDETEWKHFVSSLLDIARSSGCVFTPVFSSEQAKANELEELLPYIGRSLVLHAPEPDDDDDDDDDDDGPDDDGKSKLVALIPKTNADRSRFVAYATRVANATGGSAEELLKSAFDSLSNLVTTGCKWLKRGAEDDSLQIRLEHLELKAHRSPAFVSAESQAIHFRTVRGVVASRIESGLIREPVSGEVDAWRARHAIRRVLDDERLGIWAVEHTAQVDVDSLESEEAAFREGKRNLLSSSTTMEMGVDIGGLTLVVMTNVPPGPANYWQRAGRAGRRADGTSMTLTLALGSAHDQLVFSEPRAFLHAPIEPPRVRLDAEPLLKRHVSSYLLSIFFEEVVAKAGAGNPMKAFGTVEEFIFVPAGPGVSPSKAQELGLADQDPLWLGYERWLSTLDIGTPLAKRIEVLCRGTVLEGYSIEQLSIEMRASLHRAVEAAQREKDVLDLQRKQEEEKGDGKKDEQFLRALDYQESALFSETVIAFLASKGVLPRFGFPLDVVKLNTRWRINSRKNKGKVAEEPLPALRMERALDLALAEYIPGNEIIAGKRVFRSAGLERNWYSTEEDALSRRYFLECVKCRHVDDGHAELSQCPVCKHPAISESEFVQRREEESKQKKRRKLKSEFGSEAPIDPSLLPPSVVRSYIRPAGFAVKVGRRPKRVMGDLARVGPMNARITVSTAQKSMELVPGALSVSYAPDSRVFARAEGLSEGWGARGYGFAVCRVCGLTEPEKDWTSPLEKHVAQHRKLRGTAPCPGKGLFWRHAVLGTALPVDALSLELSGELAPPPSLGVDEQEAFFATLAAIAQLAAARCLQVDIRALSSGLATRQTGSGFTFDAVVYERATSGLLRQLAEDAAVLVAEIRRIVESENEADFVRFDTQFLRGQLKPDLVKVHFRADHRRKLLDFKPGDAGTIILRGRGPLLAAIELLGDPAREVSLLAPALSLAAFEGNSVMPRVRHRAADPAAKGVAVRLLLGKVPGTAGSEEEILLASKLRQLIADGVEVKQVAPSGAAALDASRWHVLAKKGGEFSALGGIWTGESKEQTGTRFAEPWLSGALSVEATLDEAKRASEWFDGLWTSSTAVQAAKLEPKPTERVTVIEVPYQSKLAHHASPTLLLENAFAKEGGLAALGKVARLVYVDRYVPRSLLGLYFLEQILSALQYASGATAKVVCQTPEFDGYGGGGTHRSAEQIIKTSSENNLRETDSSVMRQWCASRLKSKLSLGFSMDGFVPHRRKLLVQFAPDARYKTLKVLFDQGLDWMKRPKHAYGPVLAGPLVPGETHVVITRNDPLEKEERWK